MFLTKVIEGDNTLLPCRSCCSISIHLKAREGVFIERCPQCAEITRFEIVRGEEGLVVRSQQHVDMSDEERWS